MSLYTSNRAMNPAAVILAIAAGLFVPSSASAIQDTRYTWTQVTDTTTTKVPGRDYLIEQVFLTATDGVNVALVVSGKLKPQGEEYRVLLYKNGQLVPAWDEPVPKPDRNGDFPKYYYYKLAIEGELVAFTAKFQAPNAPVNPGVFQVVNGKLKQIVGRTTPRPGLKFDSKAPNARGFGDISVHDGKIAFIDLTSIAGKTTTAVCVYDNGKISTLVETGTPAPGGGTFNSIDEPISWSRDSVVFTAEVGTPRGPAAGPPRGIFSVGPKGPKLLAKLGEKSPTGGVFKQFFSASGGDVGCAFGARMEDNTTGVFLHDGTSLRTIAASGDSMQPHPTKFTVLGERVSAGQDRIVFGGASLENRAMPTFGAYVWSPTARHLFLDVTADARTFPGLPAGKKANSIDQAAGMTGGKGPGIAVHLLIYDVADKQKKTNTVYFLTPKK